MSDGGAIGTLIFLWLLYSDSVASGLPDFLLDVSVCSIFPPSLIVGLRLGSHSASVTSCML